MFEAKKIKCWRCKKEITVYTWGRRSPWPEDCPVEGRPSTVRFGKTSVVPDGYWGNYCSVCGVVQGDFFLYCKPEGPFYNAGQMEEQNFWAGIGLRPGG